MIFPKLIFHDGFATQEANNDPIHCAIRFSLSGSNIDLRFLECAEDAVHQLLADTVGYRVNGVTVEIDTLCFRCLHCSFRIECMTTPRTVVCMHRYHAAAKAGIVSFRVGKGNDLLLFRVDRLHHFDVMNCVGSPEDDAHDRLHSSTLTFLSRLREQPNTYFRDLHRGVE